MRELKNIRIRRGDSVVKKITLYSTTSSTQITDFTGATVSFDIYKNDKSKVLSGSTEIKNNTVVIGLSSAQTKTLSEGTYYWVIAIKIGDVTKHYCNEFVVEFGGE